MSHSAPTLHRQVARVRRRLFLQILVQTLIRGWVAALCAAVVWFLAEPFLVGDGLPNLRWYVLGGLLAAATLLGIGLTLRRAPSLVVAALSLDERFQLKERATTSLTLDPRDAQSPAALALLADTDRRVAPLHIGDRFPVKIPWTAALVPVFAVVLVLLAFFYKPALNQAQAGNSEIDKDQQLAEGSEAKKKLEQIVKKSEGRKVAEKPQSQEMQRIENELDKLVRQPLDTKDQARDALKDLTSIEDALKKQQKNDADKREALKEEMKQLDRLAKKDKKDGPADNLDNALNKGDFNKAKDEAERLSRKLKEQQEAKKEEEKAKEEVERLKKKTKDENLSKEEREQAQKDLEREQERLEQAQKDQLSQEQKEQLEEQLQNEQDKLQRLTRSKEEKEQELRDKAEKGEIDQEQLDRELEQLEKNSELAQLTEEEKQELKELAQKLGECQKCMKEGNDKEAGEKLAEAAKLLKKLDKDEQKDIQQKLRELQEVKKALTQCLDGKGNGRADSGPNKGGIGAGRRPLAKDGETDKEEIQARSREDKGQINVIDHVPGQGFKGPRKPAEMTEDIRRASQDAPEAIDRQRLPRSASDMARGFFEKMRGPEKSPEK
jgi:hypothetical protein